MGGWLYDGHLVWAARAGVRWCVFADSQRAREAVALDVHKGI